MSLIPFLCNSFSGVGLQGAITGTWSPWYCFRSSMFPTALGDTFLSSLLPETNMEMTLWNRDEWATLNYSESLLLMNVLLRALKKKKKQCKFNYHCCAWSCWAVRRRNQPNVRMPYLGICYSSAFPTSTIVGS